MNDKSLMMVFNQHDCHDLLRGVMTNVIKAQRVVLKPPFRLYFCCSKGDMMQLHKAGDSIYIRRGYGDRKAVCAGRVIGYADVVAVEEKFPSDGFYNITEDDMQSCGHTRDTLCKYGKNRKLYLWRLNNITFYDNPVRTNVFIRVCKHPYYCEMCDHAYRTYSSDVESSADLPGAFYETTCLYRLQSPPQLYCYVRRLEDE